jgi:hypothetical protein
MLRYRVAANGARVCGTHLIVRLAIGAVYFVSLAAILLLVHIQPFYLHRS